MVVARTPENPGDDIKKFSSKASDYLQTGRLTIYPLPGTSIEELEKESGIELVLTETIRGRVGIKKQRSIKSEVAFDPSEFFLDTSGDKPFDQHKILVTNDGLKINVFELGTIIGTVADYFALYVMHLKKTGEDLFVTKDGRNLAVAECLTDNSEIAILGHLLVDKNIFVVTTFPLNYKNPKMMVAPIIVPL